MSDEHAGKKILMIDDDKNLRNILGIYLDMAGYQVYHASNGEEGKEQLNNLAPDLIILDMVMPVLDGMGFLRWRNQEAKLDVPVLVLTGLTKPEIKSQALELGALEVIFKPNYPEQFIEVIKKIIG